MKNLFVFLTIASCVFCSTAHAKPRRYYSNNSNYSSSAPKTSTYTSLIENQELSGSSDQDRCQAEANYMAANNITGHVWGCIGRFEGVGYGNSPNCNTCTPSGGMRLTGDASAQGRNGMWYRVRSWR